MRIAAIVWNSHVDALARAARDLPWLDLRLISSKSIERGEVEPEEALSALRQADMVFLYRSSESFWDAMEGELRAIGRDRPVLCASFDPGYWSLSTLPAQAIQTAYNYTAFGGQENFANLLRFLAHAGLGADTRPEPPREMPWQGLYHPAAGTGHFPDRAAYLDWYAGYAERRGIAGAPWVGLLLARHYWVNRATEVEDLLIPALENKGLRVLAAFSNSMADESLGNKGALQTVEEVFAAPGGPRIAALVKLQSFFLGNRKGDDASDGSKARDGAELYARLGVPVLQPVFSSTKTVAEWEADPQGLGTEIAWCVAMPEFEGVIEPFCLGGGERSTDADSGAAVERRVPVPERCLRLAERVRRWVDLSLVPAQTRRAAFILHNNPCASVEATVGGAAKLDSLESVARIIQAMQQAGYRVEPPADGAELITTIMDRKAVSEFRWTTVEEIVAKGGALDFIEVERYRRWFDAWPRKVRERIAEAWGDPPGEKKNGIPPAMVHEGRILVTGVSFGNAAVAVQPKRGCAGSRCDGEVCKILHDPDVPPPHQYLATYRWLQDKEHGFGADVLIHVGTHGNLEFLPGKNVGLSGACLPDLALHTVPHLYIYNSDNPAEGVVAKRRGYAALVDHMQTAMTASGLYAELEEMDDLLGQYEQARDSDRSRAHQLEHLIRDLAATTNLDRQVKAGMDRDDFREVARDLHEALAVVRTTRMQDGMHVFGQRPEGERLLDFIYTILRFDDGDESSLRKTLCRAQGRDLVAMLQDPGGVDAASGRSHGRLLEDLDRLGCAAVGLALESADDDAFDRAVREALGDALRDAAPLAALPGLRARTRDIARRIADSGEIESLLRGMEAGFVPPGPSGVISRGREDILPTGRNFYTLDPRRLPTRAAWRVGQLLAKGVLDKHLKEEGRVPENVAMFWMCNDLMWSDGEGMAQIFALLGVRPVWRANGLIKGVEPIPLGALGRPRVDVTLRVSGITRDNFPQCMDLVDEAVQAVAGLDEPEELNFVRKHALARLRAEGDESAAAWRRATLRLFSARPGVYKAGVNLAVYASAWKDRKDLSDVFLYWNAFAYGKGVWGEKALPELKHALSTVDVTFNKVITDEHDLFGCCGYFGAHGGITAAAREISGRDVKAYYGDTRETEAVAVRDLADEIRRVVRTKLLNPRWIEGMKRHGYKGAGDISKRVGRVYGWEASTEEVDDWIFDDITRAFVLDQENREFFREHNPWALEEIGRRLLEAASRGLWKPDPQVMEELRERYLEMEGWLEEGMGDAGGEFQGGAVDIMSADDVAAWKRMMDDFNSGETGQRGA
ncbi:MAG: cobaltochelatase subunit CobN [Thermodesulfobacteriota bacterium]